MSIEYWLISRNGMPQSKFFVATTILLLDFGLFIGGLFQSQALISKFIAVLNGQSYNIFLAKFFSLKNP